MLAKLSALPSMISVTTIAMFLLSCTIAETLILHLNSLMSGTLWPPMGLYQLPLLIPIFTREFMPITNSLLSTPMQ